jgi:hypothetical protein
MRTMWLTAAAAAAGIVTAFGASGSGAHPGGTDGGPTPDEAGRFLPDLVSTLPGTVAIDRRLSRTGAVRRLLAFSAGATNSGSGPLIVRSSRTSQADPLVATQLVARSDGSQEVVGEVGTLRYVSGGGHSHFHLPRFMSYELRTVAGEPVGRDRKTGFCLGDRYDATGRDTRIAGEPARAVFRGRCATRDPRTPGFTQGLSVGFGDDYPARLEGQFVDITGLRTGRYVLVLRVDPDGRLLEMHRDNNVASLLIKFVAKASIRGRGDRARILSWCTSTDSCPTPGLHKR